eukprot:TRINITY_DN17120_c0_g1_i1.p1 TRINITY_DN17120_c0_g1~~TRINITY_DN17120_c0_g1_i1.p1  ORF type:complete len:442 (+),score=64.62 TRINITY_DN17120_c0_g1_i1:101-1327(+)
MVDSDLQLNGDIVVGKNSPLVVSTTVASLQAQVQKLKQLPLYRASQGLMSWMNTGLNVLNMASFTVGTDVFCAIAGSSTTNIFKLNQATGVMQQIQVIQSPPGTSPSIVAPINFGFPQIIVTETSSTNAGNYVFDWNGSQFINTSIAQFQSSSATTSLAQCPPSFGTSVAVAEGLYTYLLKYSNATKSFPNRVVVAPPPSYDLNQGSVVVECYDTPIGPKLAVGFFNTTSNPATSSLVFYSLNQASNTLTYDNYWLFVNGSINDIAAFQVSGSSFIAALNGDGTLFIFRLVGTKYQLFKTIAQVSAGYDQFYIAKIGSFMIGNDLYLAVGGQLPQSTLRDPSLLSTGVLLHWNLYLQDFDVVSDIWALNQVPSTNGMDSLNVITDSIGRVYMLTSSDGYLNTYQIFAP